MTKILLLALVVALYFPVTVNAKNYDYLHGLKGSLQVHCSESEELCNLIVEKFNNAVAQTNGNDSFEAEVLYDDTDAFLNNLSTRFIRHLRNARNECAQFSSSSQSYAKELCKENLYQSKIDIIFLGKEVDYRVLFQNDGVSRFAFPSDNLHKWAVDLTKNTDNRLGAVSMNMLGLAVNEEKNLDAPACWSDLSNNQYKNKVTMTHWKKSESSYRLASALLRAYDGRDEAGWELLTGIHKNIEAYTDSDIAGIESVANGNTQFSVAFLKDVLDSRLQGKPIKLIAPCEGSPYEVNSIGILRGAPNREAAEAFVNFVYEVDTQQLLREPYLHHFAANKSVAAPETAEYLVDNKLLYTTKRFSRPLTKRKIIEQWENNILPVSR